MDENDWLTERFEEQRPHLHAVAYRMLGSLSDADDAVQDAWLRVNRAGADALASNNGHLLWSGIVDRSKARAVARHLLGPKLFSGWGVRTLAEGEARFNPIGYHVGTV